MTKYHIKSDGTPGVCRATKRPCPLGGEEAHYNSYEEAYEAAQDNLEREFDLLGSKSKFDQAELELRTYYKENGEQAPMEYIRNNPEKFEIDESEKVALAKEIAKARWRDDRLGRPVKVKDNFVYLGVEHGFTAEQAKNFDHLRRQPSALKLAKRFDKKEYHDYLAIQNAIGKEVSENERININVGDEIYSGRFPSKVESFEKEWGMSTQEVYDKYGSLPTAGVTRTLEERANDVRSDKEIIKNNSHLPFNEWKEKPKTIATSNDDGTVSMYGIEYYEDGESPADTETKSGYGAKSAVRFRGVGEEVPVKEVWHLGNLENNLAKDLREDDGITAEVVN